MNQVVIQSSQGKRGVEFYAFLELAYNKCWILLPLVGQVTYCLKVDSMWEGDEVPRDKKKRVCAVNSLLIGVGHHRTHQC